MKMTLVRAKYASRGLRTEYGWTHCPGARGKIAPRGALAICLHPQARHHERHQRYANEEEMRYL